MVEEEEAFEGKTWPFAAAVAAVAAAAFSSPFRTEKRRGG